MQEIKETTYKGTRILLGDEKRNLINSMIFNLKAENFKEISLPILQYQETFTGKVGEENNNQMFNFKDRGDRDICLAPEYTAVIQKLASTTFKQQKDVKLFYVQECFRGEKPQEGRYRQFTQLGVEILNPTKDYKDYLEKLSVELLDKSLGYLLWNKGLIKYRIDFEKMIELNKNVTRGLDYYKDGKGFEITCDKLGAQKQICGGGEYEGGIGFALGIDRVLTLVLW